MSYSDLLNAFAEQQGLASAADLVRDHGDKYTYLIKTRDRAREAIADIAALIDRPVQGLRVLDLGSGLGSIAVELARAGAVVTAVESNAKWISLAAENAKNEAEVHFIKSDPVRALADGLAGQSFDLAIAFDVLHRVYDLGAVLEPLLAMLRPRGALVFRVPNASAPSLIAGHGNAKRYAIALMAPDYWCAFDASPIGQYHRRWGVYRALMIGFGFDEPELSVTYVDETYERAQYRLRSELSQLKRGLKAEAFPNQKAYIYARNAIRPYIREAEADAEALSWNELNFKYRIPVVTGLVRPRAVS